MFKQIKKNIAKRSRKFVLICTLIAIILTVSTYAWFIGMQTVNVTSFDVDIAATDSLLLSLDGETWSTEVTMNQDMIQEVSYEEHTNRWSKLVPMSTIGQMDSAASRLVLYEKASYTATPGGYRIMASRVDNGLTAGNLVQPEKDGYVAFDLFIKNFSGSQYIEELNFDDEEAIYLTTDSEVIVSSNGVANTGIENSMRIAFSPIGRVNGATTDKDTITGIKCDPDSSARGVVKVFNGVTGICRTDRIWEPNNDKHVINAIKWYQKSCLKRIAADLTKDTSYSNEACGIIEDNKSYPTYAVGGPIASGDRVDVYDGEEYNGYTASISNIEDIGKKLLVKYPYFTDDMKKAKGINRLEFVRLAPNSITKVRIYIFIEGQDIDNYDFSVIGKKVSVRFGFTKERFTPDDIEYNGPPIDITLPVITLKGDNPFELAQGGTYTEPGLTVYDNQCDVYKPGGAQESQVNFDACVTDLEGDVEIDSTALNANQVGTYKIIYSLEDKAGNKAIKIRYVVVK